MPDTQFAIPFTPAAESPQASVTPMRPFPEPVVDVAVPVSPVPSVPVASASRELSPAPFPLKLVGDMYVRLPNASTLNTSPPNEFSTMRLPIIFAAKPIRSSFLAFIAFPAPAASASIPFWSSSPWLTTTPGWPALPFITTRLPTPPPFAICNSPGSTTLPTIRGFSGALGGLLILILLLSGISIISIFVPSTSSILPVIESGETALTLSR